MTGFSWYAGVLTTGELTTRLPVLSSSWQAVLNGAGQLQVVCTLTDPAVAKLGLYNAAEPCRTFLAAAYIDDQGTERFLEAGPVWTHSYDDDSGQLTIGAAGLWSLWDHRFVLPVLTAGQSPAGVSSSWSALSLGTIAKRVVQQAQDATGGSVPVAFPDDETGTATRTYPGYQLTAVGEALDNLVGVQNGPEIAFDPRRNPDDPTKLQWVMRTGTTEQPMLSQAGAAWAWDASAAKAAVSGISVQRDGSTMAERVFVQGAGTGTDTSFAVATDDTLLDAGFPLMETSDASHAGDDDAADPDTLAGYGATGLKAARRAANTWACTVRRDSNPKLGTYRPGDWTAITVGAKHRYLPRGTYRSRITSISGDTGRKVQLQLQTTIEGES